MHTQTTQTKRFTQHVKCCEWYYDEIQNITNDAFLTDEEKLAVLDDLENRILTLAAPFLAVANKIKTTMEQMKK
ncbi:hypothetical protein D1K53_13225 [Salmonella enterica]|nr:hypothetical protein [Salmonella enterica]EBH9976911.1 hypothetical protein [Salmonella enterica subsp. arizonae serovar 40:z36:-]EBM4470888.1 hypothetical protein [Salmonella enterica]EBM5602816.1 hypothetical protein [Salmonella enterica]EBN1284076.1 hypothetical protein [Salmonella enterica]